MKYKTVYISVVAKIIHILLIIGIVLTGVFLYKYEEFSQVRPHEGKGEYLLHTTPQIPRESPEMLIAEDGKLILYYIDSELVNVYTVSGDYLYGIQFPDAQNGKTDMHYEEGLLYVDARLSGIYVFQDTQLLRFEEQSIYNDRHDELEKVFTGEEDHEDGGYTYVYVNDSNRVLRSNEDGAETVLQFPQRKYDPGSFLVLTLLVLLFGTFIWEK